MTKGDRAIDSGADKLAELSGKAAAKGGLAGRLAGELADDSSFLRRLKPSLIAKRARGELPKNAEPGAVPHAAPSVAQHGVRAPRQGPNPFLVTGAAFGAGTLLAKIIDWRGHAHPRR